MLAIDVALAAACPNPVIVDDYLLFVLLIGVIVGVFLLLKAFSFAFLAQAGKCLIDASSLNFL